MIFDFFFVCVCVCVFVFQSKPAAPEEPKKPTLDVPAAGHRRKRTPSASPDRTATREGLSPTGQSEKQTTYPPKHSKTLSSALLS